MGHILKLVLILGTHGCRARGLEGVSQSAHLWREPPQEHGWLSQSQSAFYTIISCSIFHHIAFRVAQLHYSFSFQFHKDARDTNDLLKRLETEINQKYNPEFKDMYQMEGLIADLDVNILRFSRSTIFFFTHIWIKRCLHYLRLSVFVLTGSGKGHGSFWRATEKSSEAQPPGAPSEVPKGDSSETASHRGSVWIRD